LQEKIAEVLGGYWGAARSYRQAAEEREKIAEVLGGYWGAARSYRKAAKKRENGSEKIAELYIQVAKAREAQVTALQAQVEALARGDTATAELQEKIEEALGGYWGAARCYSQAAEERTKGNEQIAELYIQVAKASEAHAAALERGNKTTVELQQEREEGLERLIAPLVVSIAWTGAKHYAAVKAIAQIGRKASKIATNKADQIDKAIKTVEKDKEDKDIIINEINNITEAAMVAMSAWMRADAAKNVGIEGLPLAWDETLLWDDALKKGHDIESAYVQITEDCQKNIDKTPKFLKNWWKTMLESLNNEKAAWASKVSNWNDERIKVLHNKDSLSEKRKIARDDLISKIKDADEIASNAMNFWSKAITTEGEQASYFQKEAIQKAAEAELAYTEVVGIFTRGCQQSIKKATEAGLAYAKIVGVFPNILKEEWVKDLEIAKAKQAEWKLKKDQFTMIDPVEEQVRIKAHLEKSVLERATKAAAANQLGGAILWGKIDKQNNKLTQELAKYNHQAAEARAKKNIIRFNNFDQAVFLAVISINQLKKSTMSLEKASNAFAFNKFNEVDLWNKMAHLYQEASEYSCQAAAAAASEKSIESNALIKQALLLNKVLID
jgi:hypothetical protein